MERTPRMSLTEARALPPTVDLVTAGRVIGVGRTKAHAMVKDDTWPTRVLRLGRSIRIPTGELLAYVDADATRVPDGSTAA